MTEFKTKMSRIASLRRTRAAILGDDGAIIERTAGVLDSPAFVADLLIADVEAESDATVIE